MFRELEKRFLLLTPQFSKQSFVFVHSVAPSGVVLPDHIHCTMQQLMTQLARRQIGQDEMWIVGHGRDNRLFPVVTRIGLSAIFAHAIRLAGSRIPIVGF